MREWFCESLFAPRRAVRFLLHKTMIKRSSWGHLYFVARGEILGFTKDTRMRKHLSRMHSLIKNES